VAKASKDVLIEIREVLGEIRNDGQGNPVVT
jgi:hypothetical protein